MAELWVLSAVLVGAKKLVDRFVRHTEKNRTEQVESGQHRPKAIADRAWQYQLHEINEQGRTGEQPVVFVPVPRPKPRTVVRRDPLRAARRRQEIAARIMAARAAFVADPLAAPIVGLDTATPILYGLREPAMQRLEGPTGVFDKGWIDQVLLAGAGGTR